MLFATAVSDLSIADALAEPRYRPVYVQLAREVLAAAPVPVEPFDGFDADDLDGSIERLVEFNRRSAKTHSGIYRDLMVRRRPTEKSMLEGIDGPLLRRTLELIGEIEAGRRTCEVANLELLAAYQRLQERAPALNALITELPPTERAAAGPLHGVAVAIKDNIDVAGFVTTNASTVGTPPPAAHDAIAVTRLRAAAADLLCKTNLLEYAAGSVNPAFGMTFNPRDPSRTSGGSSSGSAALVGSRRHRLRARQRHRRVDPHPRRLLRDRRPQADVRAGADRRRVPALAPPRPRRHADRDGRADGGPARRPHRAGDRARRPDRRDASACSAARSTTPTSPPVCAARVREAIDTLARAGFEVVDVDVPELDLADAALGAIVLREAWDVHRALYERERDGYGPGTRALLELGAQVTDADYERALDDKERVAAAFADVLADVDVLAGPTVAYPAPAEDPPVGTPEGDLEGRFTAPYNLAGTPAVSVPCGIAEGTLPAGLQLAAAVGNDAFLLSVARAYEEVRR